MQVQTYQGRYKVEYSTINVSELEGASRIDGEYYKPVYLKREKIIERKNYDILRNVTSNDYRTFKPECNYFSYIEIANVNLKTGEYVVEKVPCKNAPSRAKKIIAKDDVIISTVRPNRNAVAIIYHDMHNLVASTGFCKLTAERINPKYLFILFKTRIYRDFLVRKTTATMYPAVSEDDIMNLKVPIPSVDFQKQIETLVVYSQEEREKSERLYEEAEQVLLEEFGIKDWSAKTKKFILGGIGFEEEKNISIRKLSDASKADRLDAEYWEPKYDEFKKKLINVCNKKKWDIQKIKQFSEPLKYGTSEKLEYTDHGVPFLRITDVSNYTFDEDNVVYISKDDANKVKSATVKEGDLLISRSGTLGLTIRIAKEFDESIYGSYFIRVRPKGDVNIDYVALFLNSTLGRIQVERANTGAIQTNLTIPVIEEFLIVFTDKTIQNKITKKMRESFGARRKSKELLEIAKRAVEVSIETNERQGLRYISEELHM